MTLILKAIRVISNRFFGPSNLEKLILWLAHLFGIDILTLAYNQLGILKFWDTEVSGENFVIQGILKQQLKKPNLILFDVGANVGSLSKKLKEAFPKARIYSFEPNPKTFEVLTKDLSDSNTSCYCLGISSESSEQKIYTYATDHTSGHTSLYKDVLEKLHKSSSIVEMDSKTTTIDDFCHSNNINYIDFMKIDTEGHELKVLVGAAKMIANKRISIIQFEFNEMNIISRVFLKDFYDILKDFNIYRIDSKRLIPIFEYSTRNEIFQFQNLLAITKTPLT